MAVDRVVLPSQLLHNLLFAATAVAQQTGAWDWHRHAQGPPATIESVSTFDDVRERGVWFSLVDNSTFEWDGRVWRLRAFGSATPPPRLESAMAWDPVGRRSLLFGGFGGTGNWWLNDTWLWDGAYWVLATPAVSPPARNLHQMATDPARQRVILFGGYSLAAYQLADDTWEWDGSQWLQMQPLTRRPAPHFRAPMSWNPATQRVALFGTHGGPLLPVEEWDGFDWHQASGSGGYQPVSPNFPWAVPDPTGGGVRVYGAAPGFTAVLEYLWNGVQVVSQASTATPQVLIGIFGDAARGEVVAVSNGGATWTQHPVTGAWSTRQNGQGVPGVSQLVHAPWLDASIALGGSGVNSGLWLRTETDYVFLGNMPTPTSVHQLLVHPGTRDIYAQDTVNQRLWRYDWPGWTLTQVTVPSSSTPGFMTAIALDPSDQRVWCFSEATQWFYKWIGASFVPVTLKPPVNTIYYYEPFAFDSDRSVLAFYRSGTLWEWNGVAWTSFAAPNFPGSEGLTFVPGLGLMLVGANQFAFWNGASWSMHSPATPAPGGFYSAQYDVNRNKVRGHMVGFEQIWDLEFQTMTATPREPHPGNTVSFHVDSPQHAGQPWVLGMAWNTWPGIPLTGLHPDPQRVIPLAADSLFFTSLSLGLSGFLDAAGQAQKTWTLPATPSISGLRFFCSAVSVTPSLTAGLVSNGVEIYVLP